MLKRDQSVARLTVVLATSWLLVLGVQEARGYPRATAAEPAGQSREQESLEDESFQRWLNGSARLLLTQEEVEVARRMDSAVQQASFRQWFWARRDPAPETARNEFRRQFYDRLSFVEREFGDPRAGEPGWSTTAGTIYLLLGPPTAVQELPRGVIVEGKFRDLKIWAYGTDAFGHASLRVPLVNTPAGLVVVRERGSEGSPPALIEALTDASLGAIHDHNLSFDSPPVIEDLAAPLPLLGTLWVSDSGIEGELSLSFSQLYGRPEEGGMSIELALSFGGVAPGREGTINLLIHVDEEEMQLLSERGVRIALCLSRDLLGTGRPTNLIVTEVPTGRHAIVPLADDATGFADRYAVEKILTVGSGIRGRGLAVAYVEATSAASQSTGSLWLARPSSDIQGENLHLPTEGLRLLRLVDTDEEGGR